MKLQITVLFLIVLVPGVVFGILRPSEDQWQSSGSYTIAANQNQLGEILGDAQKMLRKASDSMPWLFSRDTKKTWLDLLDMSVLSDVVDVRDGFIDTTTFLRTLLTVPNMFFLGQEADVVVGSIVFDTAAASTEVQYIPRFDICFTTPDHVIRPAQRVCLDFFDRYKGNTLPATYVLLNETWQLYSSEAAANLMYLMRHSPAD